MRRRFKHAVLVKNFLYLHLLKTAEIKFQYVINGAFI